MTAAPAPPSAAAALALATTIVVRFERFSATPYLDTAGVWTIGYGTTHIDGQPVTESSAVVSEGQARALMEAELAPTCANVQAMAPPGATPHQVAACSSLAYNIGLGAFRGSTVLHLWQSENSAGAALHFGDWRFDHDPVTHQLVEVAGLMNRREAEKAMFLSG